MEVASRKIDFVFPVTLLAVSILALVGLYLEGLSGPFLFDDFGNLKHLQILGGSPSWDRVSAYLNKGVAGPTGRPLALLSFLLNSVDWPATAASFKYTNVLIHAVNGLLVFWIAFLLMSRAQTRPSRVTLMAGLFAASWMLSPYHVSTVLYVVQRMAMLAALFVLLGLILYLKGRAMLEEKRFRTGLAVILLAYIVGAGLGVLNKENAVLFVLMVPLVEWLFFSRQLLEPRVRFILKGVIVAASVAFLLVMAAEWPSFSDEYMWKRDFSLAERLLSQARALGYYLWRYLIPGYEYVGIYGDEFVKSRSLLDPASTLVWISIHVTLLAVAVSARKKLPLLAFGILFFYVAHLMESSLVPLELFFEHRNYLPSAFLLLPLCVVRRPGWVLIGLSALLLVQGSLLNARVHQWADGLRFHSSEVVQKPGSERAAVGLAAFHINSGRPDESVEVLRTLYRRQSIGVNAGLALIKSACQAGGVTAEDVTVLVASPNLYRGIPDVLTHVGDLGWAITRGECRGLTLDDMRAFLDAYITAFERGPKARHAYLRAVASLEISAGRPAKAVEHGLDALRLFPELQFASQFCGWLVNSGSDRACSCLDMADQAFERGYKKTITRELLGYSDRPYEQFVNVKKKVCTSAS